MNRQQRRAKNKGHLYNAKMGAQIAVLNSATLDVALPREREAMLQRTVIALHEEFGFSKDRIQRYIDAMRDVESWLQELADEYMQDVHRTTNRAADRKRIEHERNEFVFEKLRERAQQYTPVKLENVIDMGKEKP